MHMRHSHTARRAEARMSMDYLETCTLRDYLIAGGTLTIDAGLERVLKRIAGQKDQPARLAANAKSIAHVLNGGSPCTYCGANHDHSVHGVGKALHDEPRG